MHALDFTHRFAIQQHFAATKSCELPLSDNIAYNQAEKLCCGRPGNSRAASDCKPFHVTAKRTVMFLHIPRIKIVVKICTTRVLFLVLCLGRCYCAPLLRRKRSYSSQQHCRLQSLPRHKLRYCYLMTPKVPRHSFTNIMAFLFGIHICLEGSLKFPLITVILVSNTSLI